MINKYQQGGKQEDAIMQFVQGLALTLLADPNLIIQIAQQNPDALKTAVQVYQLTQDMGQAAQAFQQALLQQVQAAKHGAKLNYIKSLKRQCAEDEEIVYYKRGGSVDCGCVKKGQSGGKTPQKKQSPVDNFKNRTKNVKKDCSGSKMKLTKGGEVCPKCGKIHKAGIGCAVAKFKAYRLGGNI